MKVRELKTIINSLSERTLDHEVAVRIWCVTATEPRVKIKSAYCGFDWSHGIFMLVPEKELIEITEQMKNQMEREFFKLDNEE